MSEKPGGIHLWPLGTVALLTTKGCNSLISRPREERCLSPARGLG